MSENPATVAAQLPAPQAVHLDQVCDRFETAWKNVGSGGMRPRLEDYVADVPEPERSLLLHQLIFLEIDYRTLRGETPIAQEYGSRFPHLSARFLAEAIPSAPTRVGD